MQFNVIALSATAALVWGAAILIVASANLIWPTYGGTFLELMVSVYPGYHLSPSISSVLTGTFYGLVDGAMGGAIFGWLYNCLSRRLSSSVA